MEGKEYLYVGTSRKPREAAVAFLLRIPHGDVEMVRASQLFTGYAEPTSFHVKTRREEADVIKVAQPHIRKFMQANMRAQMRGPLLHEVIHTCGYMHIIIQTISIDWWHFVH
jgi:hypothetical protein